MKQIFFERFRKGIIARHPKVIPDHERPLGFIASITNNEDFKPLKSLEEAKLRPDGVVILQGDEGGQIYLSCPARHVMCSEDVLRQLLSDIDSREWKCEEISDVFFEELPVGSGIWGGMGGGIVVDGIWVHERLADIRSSIEAVIQGKKNRIIEP